MNNATENKKRVTRGNTIKCFIVYLEQGETVTKREVIAQNRMTAIDKIKSLYNDCEIVICKEKEFEPTLTAEKIITAVREKYENVKDVELDFIFNYLDKVL